MAEITLSGEQKGRSMLVPVLLALLVLAILGGWFAHRYLRPGVTGSADHVELFPVHSTFTRPYGAVGADQSEDALYVIANVALTDHTEVPLFVKSMQGRVTLEDGTVMEASPIEKADLPRLMMMFPKMKPLTEAAGTDPLLREQKIDPGATGRGWIVMSYNIPPAVWDKRQKAEVSFDFYHQDRFTVDLPK